MLARISYELSRHSFKDLARHVYQNLSLIGQLIIRIQVRVKTLGTNL